MITKLCFGVNGLRSNRFDPIENIHDENILIAINQVMASDAILKQAIRNMQDHKLNIQTRARDFQDTLLENTRLHFDVHTIHQMTESWGNNLWNSVSEGLKVK